MKRHLLHPGTALGLIALIVALSGSVYAATSVPTASVTSLQIKNGSIALKDLSPAARKALRGARGLKGATGIPGAAGAPGKVGATGAAGANGTARAFGFVSSAGAVNPARSKGITVTKLTGVSNGAYCVTPTAATGIDVSKVLPVLTPDFSDGTGTAHIAQIVTVPLTGCPAATGWSVFTDNFSAGAFAHTDIAFSVVVP